MKTILLVSIVVACFTSIQSKIVPERAPEARRMVAKPVPLLPQDFRPDQYPGLSIPNEKFCEEQALKPAHRYLILPWWYQHCITMIEKKLDKYRHGKYYLPMYRRILDQVQQFKKQKKGNK